jgi:hypothetical protein
VVLLLYFYFYRNTFLTRRSKEERALVLILFMNTRMKLGLHAQTLSAALDRGVQADARGAMQVLDCVGQAITTGSCLSQVLGRGAQAVSRGAVPCASQVLDRCAETASRGAARCASPVLNRGAQAGAQTAACVDTTQSQQEKNTRQMSRRTEKYYHIHLHRGKYPSRRCTFEEFETWP